MGNLTYTYTARNKRETTITLEKTGISLCLWSKKGREEDCFYPYGEIKRIHLFLPDIGWYTMEMTFADGRRVLLRSLSFGNKTGEPVAAANVQRQQDYRQLVLHLHQTLIEMNLQQLIRFRQGSTRKALLSLGVAALCLFAFTPMAWHMRSYGLLMTFIFATPLLVLFAFRAGYVRDYMPTQVPPAYLPTISRNQT